MTRSEAVVKLLDSGSVTWEQTRAEKKAQIAENTRLHFQREAMEAAKNESPPTFHVDPGPRLPRIPVLVADRRTGRTTRQLMSCLDRAASGQTVVFVPVHYRLALIEDALRMIVEHGRARHPTMEVHHFNRMVVFPGHKGRLTVASDDRQTMGISGHVEYDHAHERVATPPPAPSPKCVGSLKEHGPLVERWRGSLLGGSSKILMCDGCYVHAERLLAEDEHSRDIAGPLLSPGHVARTGLVPQSFGDERVGGIWAARGMR